MIFNQGLIRRLRRGTGWIFCAVALLTLSGTMKLQWDKASLQNEIQQFLQEYSRACHKDSLTRSIPLPEAKVLCPCVPEYPESLNKDRFENTDDNNLRVGDSRPLLDVGLSSGSWRPKDCVPRSHLAVIIPYRNREEHLNLLLSHLHPYLQRQNIAYQIFVIEQALPVIFNRASLMNVGFKEAFARSSFDCFIFHDVDLLPEDDRNMYSCLFAPLHLGAYMNKFDYRIPYPTFFGGAIALTRQHVEKMNGFPNSYYGWGGEDDDSYLRLQQNNLTLTRYPKAVGKSYMIKHDQDEGNPISAKRDAAYNTSLHSYTKDGLNNLEYSVVTTRSHRLYTMVSVNLEREKRPECIVDSSLPAKAPNNYVECLDNVTNYENGNLDCCRAEDRSHVYCCRLFPLSTSGTTEEPTFRETLKLRILPVCLVLLVMAWLLRKYYCDVKVAAWPHGNISGRT